MAAADQTIDPRRAFKKAHEWISQRVEGAQKDAEPREVRLIVSELQG